MFSRLAQITLLALGLTIGNHAPAAATIYGTYYDETVSKPCPFSVNCWQTFSQLPADKLLMVQKINCTALSSQPIVQAFLFIAATSGGSALSRNLPMQVPPSQLSGGTYYTSWQTDTHFLIGQGRFPFVSAYTGQNTNWGSVSCTLIGELVTPIQ